MATASSRDSRKMVVLKLRSCQANALPRTTVATARKSVRNRKAEIHCVKVAMTGF